ncbi:hypothetical protein [Pelagibacterium lacus]|uniref:HdeA/HdeB family protein n=1 Tax=Pelagibacterium lacus TaxID=2282655 RepID=A0A369WAZ0_9HYPH|nr:hypothetical protein [Pelagibacterium lacus]RDE10560.1 hypothetical protein DVH29_01010 [Pelagibacterium lacus]
MNRIVFATILAAATLASGQANAYLVKGNVTCPEIMEEHNNETYRAMNRWWLLGYITGRNYELDLETGLDVGEDALYKTAYQFCADNPDLTWDDAAYFLYDQMQ